MIFTLDTIASCLAVVASAASTWLWKELSSLRNELIQHKIHVAENYVTKDDNNAALDRVYSSLARIEAKLDERRS